MASMSSVSVTGVCTSHVFEAFGLARPLSAELSLAVKIVLSLLDSTIFCHILFHSLLFHFVAAFQIPDLLASFHVPKRHRTISRHEEAVRSHSWNGASESFHDCSKKLREPSASPWAAGATASGNLLGMVDHSKEDSLLHHWQPKPSLL